MNIMPRANLDINLYTSFALFCRELFSPSFAVRTFANDGSEEMQEVQLSNII